MSQYHCICNHDRREYVNPRLLCAFAWTLESLNESDGALWAMALLLAASNGKGSGDFDPIDYGSGPEPTEPDDHTQLLMSFVGRWAGQRVSIVGEYFAADTEAEYRTGEDAGLWKHLMDQTDGWVDISEHVANLIELDDDSRRERHKIERAPSGATLTQARGFDHISALPPAPRSILNVDGSCTAIPKLPPIDPLTLPLDAEPLDQSRQSELDDALDRARSMIDLLDDQYRQIITLAATHPCSMTWDRAHSVIVGGGIGGLWNAVCQVDPSFPKSAAHNDVHEAIWEKVPSGDLILEALQVAVAAMEERC